MRYRKRYGIQFDFIIRVGSNQKFQVSFGILNITLPIIVLIHICLYQLESVLIEKMKIPRFVFTLMRNVKRK